MTGARLLAITLLLASTPAAAVTTTFINELHYDNGGGDVGEGVEIAGLAGADLNGWRLVLYNGSNGTTYGETPLDQVIPELQGGRGVVFVPVAGMQNGSPDGLALVDDSDSVVQFLSYEGVFTAVNGAAAGMTSLNIGVEEPSDGPAGLSLQLIGTGLVYEDFHWIEATASSYGAVNNGQQFAPVPLPASLPLLLGAVASLAATNRRRRCTND